MTDRLTALRALDEWISQAAWPGHVQRPAELHTDLVFKAFEGSLDAAKALHDALLSGWDLLIHTYEDDDFSVSVSEPTKVETHDGVSEIPARAWLLAIVRALIWIEENGND